MDLFRAEGSHSWPAHFLPSLHCIQGTQPVTLSMPKCETHSKEGREREHFKQ